MTQHSYFWVCAQKKRKQEPEGTFVHPTTAQTVPSAHSHLRNWTLLWPPEGQTHLVESFELVAPVPEGAHGVHVERVLPLADGGEALLHLGHVDLLVRLPAVI